ncbi:MAG: hypothetical protein AVDCRST_MAG37-3190, partial [uncultured Rubrobacteraceae bacterium]
GRHPGVQAAGADGEGEARRGGRPGGLSR